MSDNSFTPDDIHRAYEAIAALGLSDEERDRVLDSRLHAALCTITLSTGEDRHNGGVKMLAELVRRVAISRH